MQSHFYAYMARMKLIRRWSLQRNTREENDQEHSLQVAMISHALALIANRRYGGNLDMEKVMLLAVYHEAPEVITGDVATPIKYFNPGIRDAFKDIERMASEKLLEYLPEDLRDAYVPLLLPDERAPEWRIVKAADRISAYLSAWRRRATATGSSWPPSRISPRRSRRWACPRWTTSCGSSRPASSCRWTR